PATNSGEKPVVLDLIGIAIALPAPTVWTPDPAILYRGFAFAAENQARILVITAGGGPAQGVDSHPFFEFINDRMMIEDVAINGLDHGRTPAQAMAFDWHRIAQHPTGPVHVVHQRLRDIVAGQPVEMILRAAFPLQLTQSGFALGNPVGGTQEV